MITEDYVSFETAKLLKEKGFNKSCLWYYYEDGSEAYNNTELGKIYYPKPTLQMTMKWLREVHNLFIFISTWLKHKDGTVQYYYEIRNLNDKDFETIADCTSTEFNSYEETCEAAIKYCLENLI